MRLFGPGPKRLELLVFSDCSVGLTKTEAELMGGVSGRRWDRPQMGTAQIGGVAKRATEVVER